MLAGKLRHRVPYHIQSKGQAIFAARAVAVLEADEQHMRANVQGTELYEVGFNYVDQTLYADCSCPYYLDRGTCKHIWACLLEADRLGALTEARNARWLELDDEHATGVALEGSAAWPGRMTPQPQIPEWQERINAVQRTEAFPTSATPPWQRGAEILYELDYNGSFRADAVVIQLYYRTLKKNGEWTAAKELRLTPSQAALLPDPIDAEIAVQLFGSQDSGYYTFISGSGSYSRSLTGALARRLLPLMSSTGRLRFRHDGRSTPLVWDDGPEWEFVLDIRRDPNDLWWIRARLQRGDERRAMSELDLILESGLFIANGRISTYRNNGSPAWLKQFGATTGVRFRDSEREQVLEALIAAGALPRVEADEEMQLHQRVGSPRFGLRIRTQSGGRVESLPANLLLDYGTGWLEDGPDRSLWLPEQRTIIYRDQAAEENARDLLRELGARAPSAGTEMRITPRTLPKLVRDLMAREWHVEAEGRAFRRPGEARLDVRSGIDWFELHAEIDYGGVSVKLPQLLAALRRGETMVRLGDGTFGLLPEEWLERVSPLVTLAEEDGDHLRFRKNQTMVLDALLAAQPAVEYDQAFAQAREKLRGFHGIEAADQPAGFSGHLRDYQRIGLGWMNFLRDLGFGGCLADDMGVGKTAQVLALLENRSAEGAGPSLVVAPKSLMFNWKEEAERFTPALKVVLHTGTERDTQRIPEANLVLTTYGTLLRDAVTLSEIPFDYVVLDEAQVVKNASTASSKAVRLLKAEHRLALSGTPVENHLGELWSLFEFLNPGMLGESKVLRLAGGLAQNPSEESRQLLAHALRPFILRRTKQQVARELPAKTEQTIYCELEPAQREQYDELKRHYRDKLLGRTDSRTWAQNKLQVLEALLRLRQASCHPGLLDTAKRHEPSAKLDLLFDQLAELREEGHKALVFSQFTSLLSIVRERLDSDQLAYEYLDGQTRDRQARVKRFQEDPSCPLFLISLKAGGLGLNLTAAEYVFLLDPWWNPAVESQAIDRAHRIGQTRNVFAYRLIAKDTVEEKVLELQKHKRDLADAILSEDNALLRDLKPEDLALLLS